MLKTKLKNQEKAASPKGIEKLLTEQTSVILGSVDTRLAAQDKRVDDKLGRQKVEILTSVDERLDEKFGQVMTQLDAVMKEVQAHREEDVVGARQLHRHDDQLLNHEKRIAALERQSEPKPIIKILKFDEHHYAPGEKSVMHIIRIAQRFS